jgi:hypothetical protein
MVWWGLDIFSYEIEQLQVEFLPAPDHLEQGRDPPDLLLSALFHLFYVILLSLNVIYFALARQFTFIK